MPKKKAKKVRIEVKLDSIRREALKALLDGFDLLTGEGCALEAIHLEAGGFHLEARALVPDASTLEDVAESGQVLLWFEEKRSG